MSKRKYPKVQGWWVYSIKIPSVNKYYIGVSKQQCRKRWQKSTYKNTVLKNYFNEWQDMVKTVLIDNLSSKEEALIMEDNIIRALQMNNLCINKKRSGLIYVSDINAYNKQYRENNPEYNERQKQCKKQNEKQRYQNDVEYRERTKQRAKQWYEDNKEKINKRRRQRRLKKKLEK